MRAKIIPQPSRPFRFVVPQGDGGPFPVGLRFRKLQGRCQMSQLTYRSFASRRPARYLFRAELDCGRFRVRFENLAPVHQPLAGLCQRDTHQPAAPLPNPPSQSSQRSVGHQKAGQIVNRRNRIELRTRLLAKNELPLPVGDSAHRLHHRVKPSSRGPQPHPPKPQTPGPSRPTLPPPHEGRPG